MEFPNPNTPKLEEVVAVTRDDDVETLRGWLQKGVSPMAEFVKVPLLHRCARDGAERCLQLLLQTGLDMNSVTNEYRLPATYDAIDYAQPKMVHALMSRGADAGFYGVSTGNLLHIAAKAAYKNDAVLEIIDRLLAEGVDMHRTDSDGRTPKQCTRSSPYEFSCSVNNRYQLDEAIRNRSINKEELFKQRSWPGLDRQHHEAWSDIAASWAWMKRILPQLEAKGESIGRDEVAKNPERLAWVLIGGSLPAFNEHMSKQGEKPIGLADFVDGKGMATPALKAVCDKWGETRLLECDWVQELSANDKKTLYAAIPVELRERIPDYHQTMHRLRQQAQPEGGQRGR